MLDDNQRLAARIKTGLRESGVTPAELARIARVTPQAVNGWLRTGRVAKNKLSLIARALNIPLIELVGNVVEQPGGTYNVDTDRIDLMTINVPVVGTAQLGDNGHHEEFAYPVGNGDGFVKYPTRDRNAYALRVKGDSMRPRIKPGEFVIVEPNAPAEAGSEVLVKTRDGRVMVKVLNFQRAGIIELASVNEDHRPITLEESEIELMHSVAGIAKAALYYRDNA